MAERVIEDLMQGKLDSETLRLMQRLPKEADRRRQVLEVEQSLVDWPEKILVALQPHLYIVEKPGQGKVVKCSCGFEFGDARENWKYGAMVYERDSNDGEVYSSENACDSEWMVVREFFCPGCWTQLEVEAVPPGHPIVHSYVPDLQWLDLRKE